jgi:two-component system response regulator MprA
MNTILIVDDDVENLETISKMLRRDGYHTLKARSTHDALEAVEAGTPDLFVINVLLPGIDGLGLCRRLRADARTARTPIVMLNSPDSPYGVADALNAGGDDYLRKPFALRELSARIRAHLRRTCRHAAEGMPSLRIFPDTMAVYVNDRRVELTQVEFDLLMFLLSLIHI